MKTRRPLRLRSMTLPDSDRGIEKTDSESAVYQRPGLFLGQVLDVVWQEE